MRNILYLILIAVLVPAAANAVVVTPEDSPVKLDIHGVILANAYWNSAGFVGSDIPLWTVSKKNVLSEDKQFGIIARQTRFGFKLTAPDVGSANLSGVMEADFFGGFPAVGQAASFTDLRLRLAYAKVDWSKFSLTAGQDWIIIAPLNPTTLSHFAVVGFAGAGNLWLRYPQLKVDSMLDAGNGKLGLTGGIVRPVAGSDVFAGGSLIDLGGAGERSGMPFWQGRIFYQTSVDDKKMTFGFSAHYGEELYRLGAGEALRKENLSTWTVVGDFQIPIGKMVDVKGEFFTGSNLDSFQGGINQGFSLDAPSFAEATRITAIDSTGGWLQFSISPPSKKELSFHIAYGMEDPDDKTLSNGQRSQNQSIMASVMCKPTKHFQTAFEYGWISTDYLGGGDNSGSYVNVAFGFWF